MAVRRSECGAKLNRQQSPKCASDLRADIQVTDQFVDFGIISLQQECVQCNKREQTTRE